VLKRSFELRIKFSAGKQFGTSKSASSPSPKTLAVSLAERNGKRNLEEETLTN